MGKILWSGPWSKWTPRTEVGPTDRPFRNGVYSCTTVRIAHVRHGLCYCLYGIGVSTGMHTSYTYMYGVRTQSFGPSVRASGPDRGPKLFGLVRNGPVRNGQSGPQPYSWVHSEPIFHRNTYLKNLGTVRMRPSLRITLRQDFSSYKYMERRT